MKIISLICFIFMMANFQSQETSSQTPEEILSEAKIIIDKNCGDCLNATKEGLKEGIEKLEFAIDKGVSNKKESLILLRDAYVTLVVAFCEYGTEEYYDYMEKLIKTNKVLVELYPEDTEILYEYSVYLESEKEKMKIYKKIIKIDADHPSANYGIGKILTKEGNYEEAIVYFRKSLKNAKGEEYENYRSRVIQLLKVKGKKKEAEDFKKEFKEKKHVNGN